MSDRVFVLLTTAPYQDDELWGVYSSREAAERASASLKRIGNDEVIVEELEIDAVPRSRQSREQDDQTP